MEPTCPTVISSAASSRNTSRHSPPIPKLPQVGSDDGIQLRPFCLLLGQLPCKPRHFFIERLTIVLLRLGSHIAARCEHVPMLANIAETC